LRRSSPRAALELRCGASRSLGRLRRYLPALLFALSLMLALWPGSGWSLAALGPLLVAALLPGMLARRDPAGLRLVRDDSGWRCDGAPVRLHCRGSFESCLWLELQNAGGDDGRSFLLFSDAVDEGQWRLLRRAITLDGALPAT